MADEPTNAKKRRLRAPAPTVREKAAQSVEAATNPKTTNASRVKKAAKTTGRPFAKLARWIAAPLKFVGKKLAKPAKVVFDRQPFRFIWKVIKWIAKILSIILFIRFVASAFKEVKEVTWPNLKQTTRLTWAVLVFGVVFAAFIAVIDYGLDKLFKAIILK